MAKYQRYEEYKDSGVEWLDVIPSHWVMSKIKYIAPFQVGWTPPTGNDSNFIGENIWANISDLKGKIITDTVKRISDKAAKEASMDITPKGSLLYSFKLSVGSVSFAGRDMYTNEAIASFTSDSLLPLEYLYYVLPKFLIENASTNIYGARILNQELIRNAIILKPTYEEAKTIANFLDYQTAQIDTLIDKQQTLIQLLKEKRQAVISHAVTKGLNADAPMKDSGVEWLGDVPEHWEVIKFGMTNKNAVLGGNYASSEGYDGIPVIKMGNLGRGIINISKVENLYKNDFHEIEHVLKKGDFLFNTRNSLALVGKVSIWREELGIAIYNSNILRISFNRYIGTSEYVGYLFNSDLGLSQLRLIAKGTTNVAAIYYKDLRSLVFAYPPTDEQYKIVEFLDNKCASLDLLIEKAEQAIQLMQERRTALISAAVTGKIDVRGWRASE